MRTSRLSRTDENVVYVVFVIVLFERTAAGDLFIDELVVGSEVIERRRRAAMTLPAAPMKPACACGKIRPLAGLRKS